MPSKYTIILEFPNTDQGFVLEEEIVYWLVDEYPNIDIFGGEENQMAIPNLDLELAHTILKMVKANPIKFKLLQITELVEAISELPKL